MRLQGKIAVVTGAGSGIGRGIAHVMAREAADVAVVDKEHDSAIRVSKEIEHLGHQSLAVAADVTRSDEVEEMTNAILTRFNRIDILVNNVGILGHPAHVVDMDEGDWDAVMNVNAKSAFLCSKAVARHMIKQRRGKIINISSTSGKQGDPLLAHYSASKFAVVGLTQALALELAPYGINVNAVCPGPTDTQMWWSLAKVNGPEEGLSPESWSEKFCKQIPLGKLNLPEDIGNLVCFLASDESRTITGIAVTISGGLRL